MQLLPYTLPLKRGASYPHIQVKQHLQRLHGAASCLNILLDRLHHRIVKNFIDNSSRQSFYYFLMSFGE